MKPLFVCYANCCRSVLAEYLYRHLCDRPAMSGGVDPGLTINENACAMLAYWGIDARSHEPKWASREMCEEAAGIFVMGPRYLRTLLDIQGDNLASKSYLFSDPFSKPVSFAQGAYTVDDPSFDDRPSLEIVKDFDWFRERVLQVRNALLGHGRGLVPASKYLDELRSLDSYGY